MIPTGPDPAQLAAALKAFAGAIGAQNVFSTPEDQVAYSDHYSPDETRHQPGAAVAPATVEQVQAIVRIANEHKIPLWPISRGKNFGYGGAAPVLKGSIAFTRAIDEAAANMIALQKVIESQGIKVQGVGREAYRS